MRRLPLLSNPVRMAAWAVSGSGALLLLAGCGSSGGPAGPAGTTQATLMITSTNNAQIPVFKMNLQGVSLVASDGTVVSLLLKPQTVELGSINGVARPLASVSIPQGSYASVNLSYGSSGFVVIDRSSGQGNIDIGNYPLSLPAGMPSGPNASATVKLTLTTPLVVTGSAMGLLLNVNIPKSVTYTPYFSGSSAMTGGNTTYSPVYTLSGVTLAAQPSTMLDGMVEGVHGLVTASAGGELAMTSDSGSTLNFTTSSATTFAGVSGAAAPPAGSYVAVNAALQSDGTMLATLVQTEATTLAYDMVGPILEYTGQKYLETSSREQQGPNLPNGTGFIGNEIEFSVPPQFEIAWLGGTAPAGLSFTPGLNVNAVAVGQNLATPIAALQVTGLVVPAASTVTLEAQTIDGTITGMSTANGQTSYQVSLFPNDLTAIFGTTASFTVYTTAETHTITASALSVGSVGRFHGLLFNNGGTLSMVASVIEDGVPDA